MYGQAMEVPMRDLLLSAAGVIAILVSIAHGVLGETKVFARASIEPVPLRRLLHLVWQAGTVAWIAGGVLLLAAPWMGSDAARHWIIATFAVVFGCAAIANLLATRTVHPGWIGMSTVVALAFAGY
jgi:hypothetical protein